MSAEQRSNNTTDDSLFQVDRKIKAPFTWVLNHIIDEYGPQMGAIGKALYLDLSYYSDSASTCFVGISTLAKRNAIDDSTVKRYLKKLEELGLLIRTARVRPDGSPTSNLYTLLDPLDGNTVKSPKVDGVVYSSKGGGGIKPPGGVGAQSTQGGGIKTPGPGYKTPRVGAEDAQGGGIKTYEQDVLELEHLLQRGTNEREGFVKDFLPTLENLVPTATAEKLKDWFVRVQVEHRSTVEEGKRILENGLQVVNQSKRTKDPEGLFVRAILKKWTPNVAKTPAIARVEKLEKAEKQRWEEESASWDKATKEEIQTQFERLPNSIKFETKLSGVRAMFGKSPNWILAEKEILKLKEGGNYGA